MVISIPRTTTTMLNFGIDNDTDDDVNNNNNLVIEPLLAESPQTQITADPPPIIPVVLGVVVFTAFWPLLAFLRFENSGYFHVDTFLALRGIMGDQNGMMMQDPTATLPEIMELPALSPAEQVVAAFFGPPSSSSSSSSSWF